MKLTKNKSISILALLMAVVFLAMAIPSSATQNAITSTGDDGRLKDNNNNEMGHYTYSIAVNSSTSKCSLSASLLIPGSPIQSRLRVYLWDMGDYGYTLENDGYTSNLQSDLEDLGESLIPSEAMYANPSNQTSWSSSDKSCSTNEDISDGHIYYFKIIFNARYTANTNITKSKTYKGVIVIYNNFGTVAFTTFT